MSNNKKGLIRQPECNIGTIGHVDHGKTTLIQALTGVWTSRHSEELKRGITIKLGYADVPIYKCPKCKPPKNYSTKKICPSCNSKSIFIRAVSFVDAPGHEALMATMLSGAAIMDGVILVIAADDHCPQPQTREHLAAVEVIGVKKIIIVQNKIDIVDPKRARENYLEIKKFVKGTIAENAPIIPISAQREVNIDVLVQSMEDVIPSPKKDDTKTPLMYVIRSFDINKPGTKIEKLKGGVIGGTILQGKIRIKDKIEIRPGIRKDKKEGKNKSTPIFSEIKSLHSGGTQIKEAHSGGLIAVGTLLDPSFSKADGLRGNVIGKPNMLPPTIESLALETHILERVVGTKELIAVKDIGVSENLLLHVGASITIGNVTSTKKNQISAKLTRSVCASIGSRVAISRKVKGRWRLIGYGIIV